MQHLRLGVALQGCTVEKIEVAGGMVLNALTQHVDDAAFANLCGKARQEPETVDVLRVAHNEPQLLERFGLSGTQEGEELRHLERVGTVVVLALPAK